MKEFIIEKTYSTPLVIFDPTLKALRIEGRSIPENPSHFYEPVSDWLKEYFKTPGQSLEVKMKLDYINSGSSKSILSVLKLLKTFVDCGADCKIEWHYEEDDESLRDLGKHFKSILKMPFHMVEDD